MTRARADFGLAYLDLIDKFVARAEAEDRRDVVWAASTKGGITCADSSRHDARFRQAWDDYQAARLTGNEAAIADARTSWRVAFVSRLQDQVADMAREDERHVAALRTRLDDSERLDPEDGRFPVRVQEQG